MYRFVIVELGRSYRNITCKLSGGNGLKDRQPKPFSAREEKSGDRNLFVPLAFDLKVLGRESKVIFK